MPPLPLLTAILCATLMAAPPALASSNNGARARVTAATRVSTKRKPSLELKKDRAAGAKSKSRDPSAPRSLPILVSHRVGSGETLISLARRYGTTVEALRAINELDKPQTLRVGQLIRVPSEDEPPEMSSWHPYVKPARQKGYLEIVTPNARFSGLAVDSKGRLRQAAVQALSGLLGAGGSRPPVPERLIRILIEVSDTFGRPLKVVSGYRTTSYYDDSRHKLSSAVDFSVVGVPNAVLCDYLRGLENVGVGYYPNSTFVHLDVRGSSAYWVDYSGPGEPPRLSPSLPGQPSTPSRGKHKLIAELDELLTRAMSNIEHARAGASALSPEPRADR